MVKPVEEKLYSQAEVARLFDLSYDAIHKWVSRNKVHSFPVKKGPALIPHSEIISALKEGRIKPPILSIPTFMRNEIFGKEGGEKK